MASQLLSNWVSRLIAENPLLTYGVEETVDALAIAAVNFYAGFGSLEQNSAIEPPYPDNDLNTIISLSEWAIIRPLALLYIERQIATECEASKNANMESFVRPLSEVVNDIKEYESRVPQFAFNANILTI